MILGAERRLQTAADWHFTMGQRRQAQFVPIERVREISMYARVTHYEIQQDKLSEAQAIGRDVRADVSRIPGIRAFASFSRDDGKCVIVAVYENKVAAGAAAQYVTDVWRRFSVVLAGPPRMEEYSNVLACEMIG